MHGDVEGGSVHGRLSFLLTLDICKPLFMCKHVKRNSLNVISFEDAFSWPKITMQMHSATHNVKMFSVQF